jgi:hypothetical protein
MHAVALASPWSMVLRGQGSPDRAPALPNACHRSGHDRERDEDDCNDRTQDLILPA